MLRKRLSSIDISSVVRWVLKDADASEALCLPMMVTEAAEGPSALDDSGVSFEDPVPACPFVLASAFLSDAIHFFNGARKGATM